MSKSLDDIQKEVDDWIGQFEVGYFEPLCQMACLTEEVGEVARIFNHMYGQKKKKETENLVELEEELGDVLYSVICMANHHKINLTQAFNKKMDKINSRDMKRWKLKDNK